MKVARLLVPILLLSSAFVCRAQDAEDENSVGTSEAKDAQQNESNLVEDSEDENPVGLNPDYVSDDEYNDTYDEDVDSDEEEEEEAKAKTNKALKNAKKGALGKTQVFLKKHRLQLTAAMVLIAFRREIGGYLLNKLRPEVYDDATETYSRQWMKLEPTQILKIVAFIDVMRQLQSAGKKKDSFLLAVLLLGTKNPILSSLISKAILNENSSYNPPVEQHYTFERLNDRYKKDCWALQKAANVKTKHNLSLPSSLSNLRDKPQADSDGFSGTVIVLDLGNINTAPGRIDMLRDEVSFLIHQHREQAIPYSQNNKSGENTTNAFELLVLLESPGGAAADFALASQQLLRLRKEPGIKVTVCVDKVAASGGYMIACASSPGRLFAAPFAVLGSIGVVGQALNLQKTLEGWGVRPMVFKAGKEKAPLGLIGDIKQSDMKSVQAMVDETHEAFKRHVVSARPSLADNIEDLATGKVWMGWDALEVGLIDRLLTSDEYISERMQHGARVLKLMKNNRRRGFLGGGHHQSRGGIESRIHISILGALKDRALMSLYRLLAPLHVLDEIEELDESVPLVARVGHKNIETSTTTSLPTI